MKLKMLTDNEPLLRICFFIWFDESGKIAMIEKTFQLIPTFLFLISIYNIFY